jgi:hypothetical protein
LAPAGSVTALNAATSSPPASFLTCLHFPSETHQNVWNHK